MSSKHKKLGNLADIYQSEKLDGTISRLRIDRIHPSADQPRQDRTSGVEELARSIQQDGLLSPILVTREGDGYRIIAGERRYHAIKYLGLKEAECRIISREERDYWRIAIIENLQRENLSAHEEASAIARLKKQEEYSDTELARILGKSRNYITEILSIASLPEAEAEQCREAGIDNKNILIQAVQAHKKNRLPEFIESYKSGLVKTVRQAKEFNQGRLSQEPATDSTDHSGDQTSLRPQDPTSPDYRAGQGGDKARTDRKASFATEAAISRKGSVIRIECEDADAAARATTWLKKNLPGAQL